ncbi:alpha/beta-hydrolase [Gonapodya prolifera JEL478]|uniref:Alpha/beta-hydrolase n=1 Tax=Gonapodya prolifera (strain JEL478) TaxID=1344416 RepID=A0A139ANU9_GONPJ|nr:alpha/beta-hydrolase [Gonapodya prolifera JEL478]|eukprot:KXS18165.1 alpha/beta-hydrolase [Gonapodya prolifera JEL478]
MVFLSIPHLLFSFADSVLLFVTYEGFAFIPRARENRILRGSEWMLGGFVCEYAHFLLLLELQSVFWDFVLVGWASPFFYIATGLSMLNIWFLGPLLSRIIMATNDALPLVKEIVGDDRRVPRIPSNFELMWSHWLYDIVSLVFAGGGQNFYDIVYASPDEIRVTAGDRAWVQKRYSLDVYIPRGTKNISCARNRREGYTNGRPVLIYVHGGAWLFGDKNFPTSTVVTNMVRSGWVVVNMNYRLSRGSSPAIFPDHIVDVKRAIRWVRFNIEKYGGDPRFIAISGGSAGGHLAALAAVTPNRVLFQPGFEDVDTTLHACVPIYPSIDQTDETKTASTPGYVEFWRKVVAGGRWSNDWLKENASPFAIVSGGPKDKPPAPMLVIQGTWDTLVPVMSVRKFVDACKRASIRCFYLELPGVHHGFDILRGPRAHLSSFMTEVFLNEEYRRWKGNTR